MIYKEYDLDEIEAKPRIHEAWNQAVIMFTFQLLAQFPDLRPQEVPTEKFRVNPLTNIGEIYIVVRKKRCSMRVPSDEWKLK